VPSAWLGATKQMVDGQFKQMCRQLHRSSISQSKHDTVVLLVGQLRWGRHVDSYLVREMFCASLLFSGRLETKLCCLWCTNNYIFQNLPVANSQEAASDRAPHSPGLFLFFIVLLFSLLEPLSNKLGENSWL
jgi:hypothetical protein